MTEPGSFRLGAVRASGLVLLLSCLLVSACAWLGGRTGDLDAAIERWNANRPIAYSMTFSVHCGVCYWRTDGLTVNVESIEVADSQRVTRPEDLTVDVLFDALNITIGEHPERFKVSYDGELGYPVLIDIDIDSSAYDDEWVFELHDFTPIVSETG
jgi:hypothetical protein